jgi:hypothetical protein
LPTLYDIVAVLSMVMPARVCAFAGAAASIASPVPAINAAAQRAQRARVKRVFDSHDWLL